MQLPRYFPDQDETQLKQRLKVRDPYHKSEFSLVCRLTSKNSWSTNEKDLTKDSGVSKPI